MPAQDIVERIRNRMDEMEGAAKRARELNQIKSSESAKNYIPKTPAEGALDIWRIYRIRND